MHYLFNKFIILFFSSIIFIIFLPSFSSLNNNITLNNNNIKNISIDNKLAILCSDAPNLNLKIICKQLHRSDITARSYLETEALRLEPKCAQECFNLLCMCKYFRGNITKGVCILPNGTHLKKAVRKEIRMLSDEERERFNKILKTMKQNGDYDRLSKQHKRVVSEGGAHSGPAFLLWHREFLKTVEISIRLYDSTLAIPYWDSSLDAKLKKSSDSYLFSKDFFGETAENNSVINGPYTPWKTLEGNEFLTRQVGEMGNCLKQKDIDIIMNKKSIFDCLGYTTPKDECPYNRSWILPEIIHGMVHVFCGGDMLNVSTSANDPIFYYHHCFMDFLWEMWRLKNQNRIERETQYPPDNVDCASDDHFSNATMEPFNNLLNIDALKNVYTDLIYEYSPRPTCNNFTDCGSKYLFCDRSQGNPSCVGKVKIGGNCVGFEKEDICMYGNCINGTCIEKKEI